MRPPLKQFSRRVDGVYREARAVILEEYSQRPGRFFTIVTAAVISLGLLAYWQPIRAEINARIAPTEVADANQLLPVAPGENRYFLGDYEVVSADQAVSLPLPAGRSSGDIEIKAAHQELTDSTDRLSQLTSRIDDGQAIVEPKASGAKAGLYRVAIKGPEGQTVAEKTIAWGVLAFNPNYAVYRADSLAELAMAVLDDRGKMVCDAEVTLEITRPSGQKDRLSTTDGQIVVSPDCQIYGPTSEPDYSASYQTTEAGSYQVTLVAQHGSGRRTLHDQFAVDPNAPFYVQQDGPTRIYPPVTYDHTVIFEAKSTDSVTITQTVPAGFVISGTTAKVTNDANGQKLTWTIKSEAGQTYRLPFRYRAPNISPHLFLLGPLTVTQAGEKTWIEPRSWLIASDAACQSTGTGNWNTSGTWTSCGGTTPQSADTVTILDTHNVTMDTNPTVTSVTINNGGTLTVSGSNTLTISTNYANNGTFTASTGIVTMTSTSGSRTLSGTMTGSSAFYDLTFNGSGGGWSFSNDVTVGRDLTVTLGTLNVNGKTTIITRDMTLASSASATLTLGAAAVTVGNNWTKGASGTFNRDTSTVTIDGSSDGSSSVNATQFYNAVFGKSSGSPTVTLTSSPVHIFNDLTLQGGTVTASATMEIAMIRSSGATYTPLTVNNSPTLTGTTVTLYYQAKAASITFNITGANYGTWTVAGFAETGNSSIFNLAGNFTSTNMLNIYGSTGVTGTTFNTQNYSITAARFITANGSSSAAITANFGSSTVVLSNGTADAFRPSSSGSHTINLQTSNITVTGNILFTNTGTWTVDAGTSTITMTPAASTAVSYAPNSQSLYNFTINGGNSGADVTPSAAVIVTNDLTMTAGRLIGTQNVTVNGNVAGTAGIMNLTGGTFTQRASSSKNFGTTSGSTAWTFASLTFSNSHASSGVTYTTQTGGTGGITVSSVLRVGASGDASGATTTLDAGNRTWTLSGTAGDPFQILASPLGVLTGNTSTFSYTGANGSGNTTVQASTGYYAITLNASDTFVLEGATTASSAVTITTGTLDTTGSNYALSAGSINITTGDTLTANASTITLTGISGTLFTKTGTFTQGTSDVQVTSASGTPTLLSAATTFHILTINSAATIINAGAAITTDNVAGNKLYVQSGVFNVEGNAVTAGTDGTLEVGASGTLCLGGTTAATTATCDSGITQTSAYTFPTFTTITLNATSTIVYLTDVAQTVTNTPTFGNLKFTPKLTADRIYTLGGAMTINGNLTINPTASSTTKTLTVNAAGTITVAATKTTTITGTTTGVSSVDLRPSSTDYNLSTGDLTIGTGSTLDAGSTVTTTITVALNYANSGTFTAGSSTMTFSATATGKTLSGTMTGSSAFYLLVFDGVGGGWTFSNDATISARLTITNGTLNGGSATTITLSGTSGSVFVNNASFTASTSTVAYTGAYALGNTTIESVTYYNLTLNASDTFVLEAATDVDNTLTITTGTLDTVAGQNYGLTIGGNYSNSGTFTARSGTVTFDATTTGKTLAGTLNSTSAFYNLIFNGSGGEWTPSAAVAVSSDLTVTAGSLLGTQNITVIGSVAGAGTITLTGGTFTQNIDESESFGTSSGSSSWSFATLTFCTTATDEAITTNAGGSGSITVTVDLLIIDCGGGNFTFSAGSRTWVLSGGGTSIPGQPFLIDTGTFSADTSTFEYTGNYGSGSLTIESSYTYYNLTINRSGETFVPFSALAVSNNFNITAGTFDTVAGQNYGLTVGGNYSNSGTFTAQSGTVTFNATDSGNTLTGTLSGSSYFYNLVFNGSGGEWTPGAAMDIINNLTMTAGSLLGTQNIVVNGNVAGTAGVINLTGGTFSLAVESNKNFGTTSGSTAWTFSSLTFSEANTEDCNVSTTTITTQTGGTGGITVSSILRVGKSGDTCPIALNAGNRTWTLSGTAGDPFQILASPAGTLTAATSTFNYTGANGSGNTTVQAATYYNLTINASDTFDLEAATTVSNDLTITAGTLDAVSGQNYSLTIAGNYSNSGTFTARSGTVTFTATDSGNTLAGTLDSTSAFYNLIFNGSGGSWTPSAAVAVSNDLTLTAGSLLGTQNITVSGGDATGDGTINLTGGTFTITGTGNLGGATAWTFYNLQIATSEVSANTTATGAGGITIGRTLTLAAVESTAVLNAGSKTWTLSGTTGTPFSSLGPTSTFTASTSTFTYTGNNSGGNTTVRNTTYYNLTINNGSETFDLAGTTTMNANLTITAGTLDTVSGSNYALAVKGNFANSGTFTPRSGTVTLSGTAQQTVSDGASTNTFYALTISNASGTADPGCGTSFTPGVIFSNAVTTTSTFTITTASVKVQYNSASSYAFANINWNGQDAGTKIQFRNSNLSSGTWLLNVTAVGNAQTKISYVDVGRSDASSGAQIIASDGTNLDCSNNTNWMFDEILTLSLDSTSKAFGIIQPGANPSDQTTTLTVTSNANSGFVVYSWSTQAMTESRSLGTVADWSGTNTSPTTFSAGSYGFGYTTDDSSLTGGTADRFTNGGAKYAGFSHTGPGDPVADRTAPATAVTNTISYRFYPNTTSPAGDYSTVIVYIIAATFP